MHFYLVHYKLGSESYVFAAESADQALDFAVASYVHNNVSYHSADNTEIENRFKREAMVMRLEEDGLRRIIMLTRRPLDEIAEEAL